MTDERINGINHKPSNGCKSCESLWEELSHWKTKEAIAQHKIVEMTEQMGELKQKCDNQYRW